MQLEREKRLLFLFRSGVARFSSRFFAKKNGLDYLVVFFVFTRDVMSVRPPGDLRGVRAGRWVRPHFFPVHRAREKARDLPLSVRRIPISLSFSFSSTSPPRYKSINGSGSPYKFRAAPLLLDSNLSQGSPETLAVP